MLESKPGSGKVRYSVEVKSMLDVVLGASQKGLMVPPGIGFTAVNDKAFTVAARNPAPRFYWDWRLRKSPFSYRKFCGTPPHNMLMGLRAALERSRSVCEGARRLPGVPSTEQGAGALDPGLSHAGPLRQRQPDPGLRQRKPVRGHEVGDEEGGKAELRDVRAAGHDGQPRQFAIPAEHPDAGCRFAQDARESPSPSSRRRFDQTAKH